MVFIGIDPGANIGFAIWNPAKNIFDCVQTIRTGLCTLFEEFEEAVLKYGHDEIYVVVEDARLRSGNDRSRLQGVGSVRSVCREIENYLKKNTIAYLMVKPLTGSAKAVKKDPKLFRAITGFRGITSEHARDAAMLVFQRNRYIDKINMKKRLHMSE